MDIPTIYCEQLGATGFQYLNIITNGFFLLFAILYLKGIKKSHGVLQPRDYILTALFILISAGSFLWHFAPSAVTDYGDTLPIIFFTLTSLFLIIRKVFNKNIILQTGALLSIFVIGLFLEQLPFLNGSLSYIFLLLIFIAITIFFKDKNRDASKSFCLALLLFFVGILARTFDLILCNYIPFGTHFLWHILVASMGYFLLLGISALHNRINHKTL